MKLIRIYQHYNEAQVDHSEDRMHHNAEHHEVIVRMVRDYLEHHDRANQNLTNVLLHEIPLSKQMFLIPLNSISKFYYQKID